MEYIETGQLADSDDKDSVIGQGIPSIICMSLFPGTIWMERAGIRVNGSKQSFIEYTRIVQIFRKGNYWMFR